MNGRRLEADDSFVPHLLLSVNLESALGRADALRRLKET